MTETKKVEKKAQGNVVRDFFLTSAEHFKEEVVEFQDGKGKTLKVLIREPNAKERGQIFKAATKLKRNQEAEIDHAELQVWAVIYCAHDFESGEPLFEPAHRDILLKLPSSVFDVLAKPAIAMIGEEPEEVAGN